MSYYKKHRYLCAIFVLASLLSSTHVGRVSARYLDPSAQQAKSSVLECFTGLMLPQFLGKKLARLHAPLRRMEKRNDIRINHLPKNHQFHVTLRHTGAPQEDCIAAKNALACNIDKLSPVSILLSKNNEIGFFKAAAKDQYHIIMKVKLEPESIGHTIDSIYQGILPNRRVEFIPHITLGKITTDNPKKAIKAIKKHLLKNKLFEQPTEIVIDEVKFDINKKPKNEEHIFKLSRSQPRKNNRINQTIQYV